MIAFGRWLAEQRKTRFWSQSVLAEKLDVSQNTVSRWETGEAFPSPSHLQKIAELFGVTLDDILRIARQESLTEAEPAGYCIAETNGKLSVLQKPPKRNPTAEDFKIKIEDTGIEAVVISDGEFLNNSLRLCSASETDINRILKKEKTNQEDVFIMTYNRNGDYKIINKE